MNESSKMKVSSTCGEGWAGAVPSAPCWESLTREELVREVQLLSLRRQVTPHFLFNSISVAISLTLQSPATAVKFLRHLASMYRYLLTYGNEYAVPIEQELEMMRQYYELISLRYVGSIRLTVSPEAKRLKGHPLPPLALQGLLENAIKHNAHSKEQPLDVRLSVVGAPSPSGGSGERHLCISNNIVPMVSKAESTRKGLTYMNETLRLLYNKEIRIENDGSIFSVLVPLI